MWKDSDYRELFQNFIPEPPEKVWERISYAIDKERNKGVILPFFNRTQKLTLVAASIASVFLSAFMYSCIDVSEEAVIDYAETSSHVSSPDLYQSVSIQTLALEPKILSHRARTPVYISPKRKISTRVSIPKEYAAFEKEILELAELDRQIAILGEELSTLKSQDGVRASWQSPLLASIESGTEKKTTKNWSRYTEQEDEIQARAELLKKSDEELKKSLKTTSFFDKLYITPFMGTNYTQVTYKDKPANNYYSDKAQFSGQFGYNVGIQFGYQLTKRWSLESGIGLGQYILAFKEDFSTYDRKGTMYIDQLDIPLMARYSIPLGSKEMPMALSVKGGLIYSNVIFYQINYVDRFNRPITVGNNEQFFSVDVDKRQYNSTQLGYTAGFDFDAYFSKKIALNLSMLNALVSQSNNFPLFNTDNQRPIQFSTSFSIGTKIRF